MTLSVRSWSRRLLVSVLAAALGLGALALPAGALPAGAPPASALRPAAYPVDAAPGGLPASENGRYLVQFAPRADVSVEARSMLSEGVAVRRTFGRAVKAAVVTATRDQLAQLARDPQVVAVEPDAPIHASGTQSNAPWGLDRVDQRSLPLSTTYTAPATGQGVTVYVVDTGVLAAHLEFGGRVAPGWTSINDGLGTTDCNGHGTHVAGTVAGTRYGVAKAATVVPVRVLDCQGNGSMSDLLEGLDWIAQHHPAGSPAVVNMSIGGETTSSIIDSAVDAVMQDGVTAVVAAGNDTADACTASPARVPGALTVAASDESDQQSVFSNYGSCVDLYAPGSRIVSAGISSVTGLATFSGTSMATPHVAGAAAVLLAQQPRLTPSEVASRLSTAATFGAVRNATPGTPNRLLYVTAATTVPATEPTAPTQPAPIQPAPILEPVPVPSEPDPEPEPDPEASRPSAATALAAAARRRAARLTWVRGDDGGSPLTGQVVRVYRGDRRIAAFTVPADTTAVRVTGLRPGVAYRFTVVEKNGVGKSPESRRSNKVRPRH